MITELDYDDEDDVVLDDDYIEELVVEQFYRSDSDLMYAILDDPAYSDFAAALTEVADGDTIRADRALDRVLDQMDEQTFAWLARDAESPARILADLIRGRAPAELT